MVPYQRASTLCDAITIKHEPVEAESHIPQEREIEYISVKEEAVEWEEPDADESTRDPLSIDKQGCSASDDVLMPKTVIIDKTEAEELDEAAASEDDVQEIKHGILSASSGSEAKGAVPGGVEDNRSTNGSPSLVATTSLAAEEGNRVQYCTKAKATCGYAEGAGRLLLWCEMCKMKFTQLKDLKEHTHTNLNVCDVCHKTFKTAATLKRHYLVHTGERPYICVICNKRFRQRQSLVAHSSVHTGERPYSCGFCQKTFRQSAALRDHLMRHNGELPFSCGQCKKSFTQSAVLKRHYRIHSREKLKAMKCVTRDAGESAARRKSHRSIKKKKNDCT